MNHRSPAPIIAAIALVISVAAHPADADSEASSERNAGASSKASKGRTGKKAGKATGKRKARKDKARKDRARKDKAPKDRSEGASSIRPWAEGVPPDQKKRALAIYDDGNKLLADGIFGAAVVKYREALNFWNHPGIHYNLMIALVGLDRPIEAYESCLEALHYGEAALQADEYARALTHLERLKQEVAEIEVVCHEPGAIVTLDGKVLFTGPGSARKRLRPGKHSIAAQKTGFQHLNRPVELSPGFSRVELGLTEFRRTTAGSRRWAAWKPWTVVAAGVVMGVTGVVSHASAGPAFARYDAAVNEHCPTGCYPATLDPTVQSELDELKGVAESRQRLGNGFYITGAAIAAAGVALVYLNRPRLRHETGTSDGELTGQTRGPISITPSVSPTSAGLTAVVSF